MNEQYSNWCDVWLPKALNDSRWVTAHSLSDLEARTSRGERFVLPICSFGHSPNELEKLGGLVLPPIFVEAIDDSLRAAIIAQVRDGFPYMQGSKKRREWKGRLDVVDVRAVTLAPPKRRPRVIAFSVDTAVEEHGPHLPLATDRIQSYAALEAGAEGQDDVMLAPPLDYGFLRWGLPAGMSVDLTQELTTRYTARYIDALAAWAKPDAVYVVDVHGSPLHRKAVDAGVSASSASVKKQFRYVHDPIADEIAKAGDPHAGGIETAIIQAINPALVDARWWPDRAEQLAREEMKLALAIELAADMPKFIAYAESHAWNGIVGNIRNFANVDGKKMLKQICDVVREDLLRLLENA